MRDDNRASIEAMVKTRVAASDASIDATRSSLSAGFDATRDITAADSKKELEAYAN